MIDLRDFGNALLTSALTAAAVALIARRLVEGAIAHQFRLRELATQSELGDRSSARSALFGKELAVYPEMLELVYRSRNAARECSSETTRRREALDQFSGCKFHLTENLYTYSLFLPDDMFRSVHRFKTELQEFGVLLDELTRSAYVDDSPVDESVRLMAARQIAQRYVLIDRQYKALDSAIRGLLKAKVGAAFQQAGPEPNEG